MLFLKPLVNQKVFVYLPGGGVLKGKLLSCAEDHLVLRSEEEKRGGEKIELDRFVPKHAVQWAELDKGQEVD